MKKLIVAIIGSTVVLIGLALLILPGPGLLVVAAGLTILATEFIWARRALRNAKGAVAKARRKCDLAAWLRMRRSGCSSQSTNVP